MTVFLKLDGITCNMLVTSFLSFLKNIPETIRDAFSLISEYENRFILNSNRVNSFMARDVSMTWTVIET